MFEVETRFHGNQFESRSRLNSMSHHLPATTFDSLAPRSAAKTSLNRATITRDPDSSNASSASRSQVVPLVSPLAVPISPSSGNLASRTPRRFANADPVVTPKFGNSAKHADSLDRLIETPRAPSPPHTSATASTPRSSMDASKSSSGLPPMTTMSSPYADSPFHSRRAAVAASSSTSNPRSGASSSGIRYHDASSGSKAPPAWVVAATAALAEQPIIAAAPAAQTASSSLLREFASKEKLRATKLDSQLLSDVQRSLQEDWFNSFRSDHVNFESLAVFCEVKLNEVFALTQDLPLPNPLRTQVCCTLFERLCDHAFGRFRLVMSIIKNELFRAIFVDYDAHASLAKAVEKRDPRAFCYLPPGTQLPVFEDDSQKVDGKNNPSGLFGAMFGDSHAYDSADESMDDADDDEFDEETTRHRFALPNTHSAAADTSVALSKTSSMPTTPSSTAQAAPADQPPPMGPPKIGRRVSILIGNGVDQATQSKHLADLAEQIQLARQGSLGSESGPPSMRNRRSSIASVSSDFDQFPPSPPRRPDAPAVQNVPALGLTSAQLAMHQSSASQSANAPPSMMRPPTLRKQPSTIAVAPSSETIVSAASAAAAAGISLAGLVPTKELIHRVTTGMSKSVLRVLQEDLSDDEDEDDIFRVDTRDSGERELSLPPSALRRASKLERRASMMARDIAAQAAGLPLAANAVKTSGYSSLPAAPASLQRSTYFEDFVRLSLINRIVKTQADKLTANQALINRFARIRANVLEKSSQRYMRSILFHTFHHWRDYTKRRGYLLRKCRRILRGDGVGIKDAFLAWRHVITVEKKNRMAAESVQEMQDKFDAEIASLERQLGKTRDENAELHQHLESARSEINDSRIRLDLAEDALRSGRIATDDSETMRGGRDRSMGLALIAIEYAEHRLTMIRERIDTLGTAGHKDLGQLYLTDDRRVFVGGRRPSLQRTGTMAPGSQQPEKPKTKAAPDGPHIPHLLSASERAAMVPQVFVLVWLQRLLKSDPQLAGRKVKNLGADLSSGECFLHALASVHHNVKFLSRAQFMYLSETDRADYLAKFVKQFNLDPEGIATPAALLRGRADINFMLLSRLLEQDPSLLVSVGVVASEVIDTADGNPHTKTWLAEQASKSLAAALLKTTMTAAASTSSGQSISKPSQNWLVGTVHTNFGGVDDAVAAAKAAISAPSIGASAIGVQAEGICNDFRSGRLQTYEIEDRLRRLTHLLDDLEAASTSVVERVKVASREALLWAQRTEHARKRVLSARLRGQEFDFSVAYMSDSAMRRLDIDRIDDLLRVRAASPLSTVDDEADPKHSPSSSPRSHTESVVDDPTLLAQESELRDTVSAELDVLLDQHRDLLQRVFSRYARECCSGESESVLLTRNENWLEPSGDMSKVFITATEILCLAHETRMLTAGLQLLDLAIIVEVAARPEVIDAFTAANDAMNASMVVSETLAAEAEATGIGPRVPPTTAPGAGAVIEVGAHAQRCSDLMARTDTRLSPIAFIETLVRIAVKLFSGPEMTPSSKFAALLSDHIAPVVVALQPNSLPYRTSLLASDHQLQVELSMHTRALQCVFLHYALGCGTEVGAISGAKRRCLSIASACLWLNDWIQLLKDVNCPLPLTAPTLVFCSILELEGPHEGAHLSFSAFCEAVVAVAAYRDPNPFSTPARRFDSFLVKELYPTLSRGPIKILPAHMPLR